MATGDTNKNDPNDARSVAVAALRSSELRAVQAEDHAAVMKVWAKRHRDLARHRSRVVCRLHAVLCDLVPGGIAGEITAAQAIRLLENVEPVGAVPAARHELALELVADVSRLDAQLRETKKRIAAAVTASKTTVTTLFGVGPIVAATVIGDVGDVSRFPSRDHFAATTAPPRSRCPPVHGTRCSGCRGAATVASTTSSTWPQSPRSVTATAKDAPSTTARSPKDFPAKQPSGRSNAGSVTPSTSDCARTSSRRHRGSRRAREGTRGTSCRRGRLYTPNTDSSAKPLPDPTPHYDRPPTELDPRGRRHPRQCRTRVPLRLVRYRATRSTIRRDRGDECHGLDAGARWICLLLQAIVAQETAPPMTTTTFITERLDELEANLPAVPARVVRLQRAIAGAACDQTAAVATAVATSTRTVLDAARISGRTVTGQARAAADDVVSSARGGARQVTGQARAQGRRIAGTASRETTQLLDSAIDTVEDVDATVAGPGAGTPYEEWTKAQLLERARQLDVEGAYKLNKRQLVKALRSA